MSLVFSKEFESEVANKMCKQVRDEVAGLFNSGNLDDIVRKEISLLFKFMSISFVCNLSQDDTVKLCIKYQGECQSDIDLESILDRRISHNANGVELKLLLTRFKMMTEKIQNCVNKEESELLQ